MMSCLYDVLALTRAGLACLCLIVRIRYVDCSTCISDEPDGTGQAVHKNANYVLVLCWLSFFDVIDQCFLIFISIDFQLTCTTVFRHHQDSKS